ncbi:MAG: hypothetical protein AB9M53_03785 [Leptothrix sp. (in: b-proteobacteria)]
MKPMRATLLMLGSSVILQALSGCVVAPPPRPVVVQPRAIVVEPAYPSPGPGWVWIEHPRRGWGWYHRDHGWHRGWHD